MNCDTHEALLLRWLEGKLTPEEEAQMQAHEDACPDCAQRRLDAELLRDDLADMAQEEEPLPENFHAGWMSMVQQEADLQIQDEPPAVQARTRLGRRGLLRALSVAAAAVVLVGGTLLTRDKLGMVTELPAGETGGYTPAPVRYMEDSTANGVAEDAGGTYGMMRAAAVPAEDKIVRTAALTLGTERFVRYMEDSTANGVAEDAGGTYGMMRAAAVPAEDKIVRTAALTLGTERFEEALTQVQALCEQEGGRISYLSRCGDAAQGSRQANLNLAIPVERLAGFLTQAGGLGRVIDQTESSRDVTESYQDMEARLATQQAKMDRLQAMMAQTATLSELLELENAIADTQYTLDSLQGQLQHTDSQVQDAAVEVCLQEENGTQTAAARETSLGQRLSAGLAVGWRTFSGFVKDMMVFLSAALPYLAAAAGVILVVRLCLRHQRRERRK